MTRESAIDHKPPPPPAAPITATVHAEPLGSTPAFWIEWSEPGVPPSKGPIECKAKTGARVITFELVDDSGLDLSFAGAAPPGPGDARAAMYVSLTQCPEVPGDGGQIVFGNPPGKTQLKVTNRNSGEPCDLHYQLNFVTGKGDPHNYDPVIKNGGDSV